MTSSIPTGVPSMTIKIEEEKEQEIDYILYSIIIISTLVVITTLIVLQRKRRVRM